MPTNSTSRALVVYPTLFSTKVRAAFRVKVSPIDHGGDAEVQIEKIREGLRAARRLLANAPDIQSPSVSEPGRHSESM